MSLPTTIIKISKPPTKDQLLPIDPQAGSGRRRMSDFIDDFIQEYKNNPCLWKANSVNFKNRTKRQEAYMKLIEVATKHGEHYNIERTKQKINNLRCAFRHQLKKYTECKNSKNGKDETYCPKRRYFESLMFLMEEEKPANRLKLAEKLKEIKMTKVSTTTKQAMSAPILRRKEITTRSGAGNADDAILQMKVGIDSIDELDSNCVEMLPEDDSKEVIEIDQEEEEAGEETEVLEEDVTEQHLEEAELCDADGNEFCTITEEGNAIEEIDDNSEVKIQSQSVYETADAAEEDRRIRKHETSDGEIAIECEDEEINILWPRPPPSRSRTNEPGEMKSIEIVHVETQPSSLSQSQSLSKVPLSAALIRHDMSSSAVSSAQSVLGQNNVVSTTLTLPTSITIQPVSKTPQVSSNIIENQQRRHHQQRQLQTRQSLIRRRTASVSSNNSNMSIFQGDVPTRHDGNQENQQQQVHYLHSSNEQQSHQHTSHEVCGPPEKKIKVDCSSSDFEKLLTLACSRIGTIADPTTDDNFSMFGRMVAHKLRSMESQQAMFAEKIISDVLFDGHMRLLNYPSPAIPLTITQHHRPRSTTSTTTGIPFHHAQHINTSNIVGNTSQTYVISSVDLNGTPTEIQATSSPSTHHHHHQLTQSTNPHYTTPTSQMINNKSG